MKIGTIKKIKDSEYRVGFVPGGVNELMHAGHQIFIEKDAGLGSGVENQDF
jgi:alanine dehydrogenase